MAESTSDPAWTRERTETELAARMSQRNDLKIKLDHFIQTRQDTTSVGHELEEVEAQIARLQQELAAL
ncbi:MAG: hypothetical protein KDH17_22150 [Rhodocyclaceae bacterium]|nr:hypothetical protein [Rhodocyclaceae bacterium]